MIWQGQLEELISALLAGSHAVAAKKQVKCSTTI